jgi:S1-C subfamily serine protease
MLKQVGLYRTMRWVVAAAVALVVIVAGAVAPIVAAQLDPALRERIIPAAVQVGVLLEDGDGGRVPLGIASGTVVSGDGLVLTNAHVVDPTEVRRELEAQRGRSEEGGEPFPYQLVEGRFVVSVSDGRHPPEPRFLASVVAEDAALDLAVLRIDADSRDQPVDPAGLNLPVAALGTSETVDIGESLHVFGFPAIGSGSLVYTAGIVSGFLYEDGIDGPAWINTDAVMSGGNSGGAAIDAAGALVGVPTSGTPLDCRPGDTDGDGRETTTDSGCVPTGGSLGQVRPIDLALPLLRSVDAALVDAVPVDPDAPPPAAPAADATSGVVAEQRATTTAAAPGDPQEAAPGAETGAAPAAPAAPDAFGAAETARSCAGRGDFRCAAQFFASALEAAPDDTDLRGEAYDALLGLGSLEEDAGQLGEARSAYEDAVEIDPTRPEAGAALAKLEPYARIRYADGFGGDRRFAVSDDPDSTASYGDGTFEMVVRQPGLISGYPLGEAEIAGEAYAVALDVASTAGTGAVALEFRTDPAGGEWMVTVDPAAATWAVYQKAEGGQFTPWVEPRGYSELAGSPLARVEVRVVAGVPALLVNGVDVSGASGIALPGFGSEGTVGFGATMDLAGGEPFAVAYDRVTLYELA